MSACWQTSLFLRYMLLKFFKSVTFLFRVGYGPRWEIQNTQKYTSLCILCIFVYIHKPVYLVHKNTQKYTAKYTMTRGFESNTSTGSNYFYEWKIQWKSESNLEKMTGKNYWKNDSLFKIKIFYGPLEFLFSLFTDTEKLL